MSKQTEVRGRLAALTLDDASAAPPNEMARHERETAIADLLADNQFALRAHPRAAYRLHVARRNAALIFAFSDDRSGKPLAEIPLALGSFQRSLRTYWAACEEYYGAAAAGRADALEAMDAHRRQLHGEGAAQLRRRLAAHVEMDEPSARRLFTLLAVLQMPAARLSNAAQPKQA